MRPRLSIVLIAHNEEKTIGKVVRDYHRITGRIPGSEIIVCEDGSTDRTPQILRGLEGELGIMGYSSKERKGYLRAARDAIGKARGDWIFFSDSDDEHDADDFWKLYEKRDMADLISGRRIKTSNTLLRRTMSLCFIALIRACFGIGGIRDFNAGFKLFNSKIRDDIVPKIKHIPYGFSTEMILRSIHAGHEVVEVPVSFEQRKDSDTRDFSLRRIPDVLGGQLRGIWRLRGELADG